MYTHECPVCHKPMLWEPADDHDPAGWVFDCECLSEPKPVSES